jgi:hypothetical protein
MKPMTLDQRRLLAVVVLLLCVGCKRDESVSERIAAQIRSGATNIDLGHLANFDWEQLFVFGPYADPKGMCKTIKLSPSECSTANFSDVDEGEFLLVFMSGHKVARRESFRRLIGNFDDACCWKAVARAKAQFTIDRNSSGVYLRCP